MFGVGSRSKWTQLDAATAVRHGAKVAWYREPLESEADRQRSGYVTVAAWSSAIAKIQADDVARIALDGAANGRLFLLPHRDGRGLWLFKRLAPKRFYRMVPKLMALRAGRR